MGIEFRKWPHEYIMQVICDTHPEGECDINRGGLLFRRLYEILKLYNLKDRDTPYKAIDLGEAQSLRLYHFKPSS